VKLSRRAFLHLASGAAALPAISRLAGAQAYAVRPVTVIEPFGESSVPDITIRIMAPRLSELLGQPVIVENVVGAGGQIGASRVARGAADGYHLLIGTVSSQAFSQTLFKKPPYDAATDFAPIILLAEQPMMLVTSEALPVENLRDFIASAVFSKHRSAILSEVATADEQGLTDFEGKQWSAIFAPKRTPAPLIKRLHDAFNVALETPEVRARIESYGAELVGHDRRSPEYLQKFVESEIRKWAVPINTSGAGGQYAQASETNDAASRVSPTRATLIDLNQYGQ